MKLFNTILLQIKVPHQVQRSTRSLKDMSDGKAKEWENFILYYRLPLFKFILDIRKVEYWSLFVESLYTLLKVHISFEESKADENLHKFVFLIEKFFSKKAMTYNIHHLLHLFESVKNWVGTSLVLFYFSLRIG